MFQFLLLKCYKKSLRVTITISYIDILMHGIELLLTSAAVRFLLWIKLYFGNPLVIKNAFRIAQYLGFVHVYKYINNYKLIRLLNFRESQEVFESLNPVFFPILLSDQRSYTRSVSISFL